jgi:electron transfer flavoprotein alpha subunit
MSPERKNIGQIWIWAEHYDNKITNITLGLISRARELCQQLGGGEVASVLVGETSQQLATELIDYGCDKVYLPRDLSPSNFHTEHCTSFMTNLINTYQPDIVLWGATTLEREIASRVAARLETGLTAHCISLRIEEINNKYQLVTTVAGWGDNLILDILCPEKRPQMATIRPGIFTPSQPSKREGKIVPVDFNEPTTYVEVVEVTRQKGDTSLLEEAQVVVAGGWGMKCLDSFDLVNELAQLLGGSVAGTRPALDAGWISMERMIGQSGKTVSPRLLVTLGVSGAAQFASAIVGARFILAVDKNPMAPIFEMADVGIVGDLREILPLFIERVREKK